MTIFRVKFFSGYTIFSGPDDDKTILYLYYNVHTRERIRHIAENETTKKPGVTSPENQRQPSEPRLALVHNYDII